MNKARFALDGALALLLVWGAAACGEITYHPEGWDRGTAHGAATLRQQEDCTLCHGEMLRGGNARVGCQSCHGEDWVKDCNWCHGEEAREDGAPPRDLDGLMEGFVADIHTEHLQKSEAGEVKCLDCHKVPEEAWAQGHLFDDTPGVAEVSFGERNPEGRYDGSGLCSSLYCHGNGRAVGNVAFLEDREGFGCQSCHSFSSLSGKHRKHLREGVDCEDCHGDVALSREDLKDASLHLDGEIHLKFPEEIVYDEELERCTGRCHRENHRSERW